MTKKLWYLEADYAENNSNLRARQVDHALRLIRNSAVT